MIDVIGGRAGDGLDRFLDNTDAFAAGVSSTVTGGLSDKVRAAIYGDITDQSDNGWYTAGQVVGIAPAFATGLATGGTGALALASKAFATLDTAHGFYESVSKFANGEPLHWTDYASFLPLGGALTSKFASRFRGTVSQESLVRGGTGHGYAANALDGGTGRAFSGHGELRYASGSLIVPQGFSITMPRSGHQIQDVTGRLMEQADWDGLSVLARTNPKVADDLIGMSTYLPGARIPNFTLKAPDGLTIMKESITVEDATLLQELIQNAQGNWCWAACTRTRI